MAPAGLPQGPRRRPAVLPRGRHRPRAAPQSRDRDRRRPADREARHRAAPDRFDRNRPAPRGRRGPHQQPRRGRPAVLPDAGLRGLRPEHPGAVAAGVLVQLAPRRLPRLPGPWRAVGLRPRTRRARSVAVAAAGRDCPMGGGRPAPRDRGRHGPGPQLRDRRHRAVRQAAEAVEGPAALRAAGGVAVERERQRPGQRDGRRRGCRRRGAATEEAGAVRRLRAPEGSVRQGLRRHHPEPAPPLRAGHLGRPGRHRALPIARAVRRVSRRSAAPREPRRPGEGAHHSATGGAADFGCPWRVRIDRALGARGF